MSVLAAIRPDEWGLPLYLHVLGALALTAALVLAATYLFAAWRSGDAASLRLGLRALLIGVIPSWIVLRVSSEWIADKEGLADADLAWIDIGYMTTDAGFLLILISSILAWLAVRRAGGEGGGSSGAARVSAVLVALLVILNVVAIWAMTTKPV